MRLLGSLSHLALPSALALAGSEVAGSVPKPYAFLRAGGPRSGYLLSHPAAGCWSFMTHIERCIRHNRCSSCLRTAGAPAEGGSGSQGYAEELPYRSGAGDGSISQGLHTPSQLQWNLVSQSPVPRLQAGIFVLGTGQTTCAARAGPCCYVTQESSSSSGCAASVAATGSTLSRYIYAPGPFMSSRQ